MTAPNGTSHELMPVEPQVLATVAFEGAMAGWTHTRRLEQVESYEPITQPAIPVATAQRPGPTPQLATAVANMELALRAVLIGAAVLVVVLLAVRVVGWLA